MLKLVAKETSEDDIETLQKEQEQAFRRLEQMRLNFEQSEIAMMNHVDLYRNCKSAMQHAEECFKECTVRYLRAGGIESPNRGQ